MKSFDNTQENKLGDAASEILSLHPSKRSLAYALHTRLNEFERHLDDIMSKHKNIAITWLLATYAAIGFRFSVESSQLQTNNLIVVSIICLLGLIGISSIWYLELAVYKKFWGAFFVESVKMENKYDFLPRIRNISLTLGNIKSRVSGHGNFYIYVCILLLLTGGLFCALAFSSLCVEILIMLGTISLAILVGKKMRAYETRLQKALEKLAKSK